MLMGTVYWYGIELCFLIDISLIDEDALMNELLKMNR